MRNVKIIPTAEAIPRFRIGVRSEMTFAPNPMTVVPVTMSERDEKLVGRRPHRLVDAEALGPLFAVAIDGVNPEVDADREEKRRHRDEHL